MIEILTLDNISSLLVLTILEIVLGIDNIVFLAVLVGKLPPEKRASARVIGLMAAMGFRIVLLLMITWVMGLTEPLFSIFGGKISGRDLILLSGGLFLLWKATMEIHSTAEGGEDLPHGISTYQSFLSVIVQIVLIDLVFSLDSVITAVGLAENIWIMIIAIVIAMLVMLAFSKKISDFIEEHPTFKMLALSFLLLVGVMLIADGCGVHIDRGYLYFAMAFSLLVEALNTRVRKKKGVKAA